MFKTWTVVFLVLVNVSLYSFLFDRAYGTEFGVYFLPVGQGDAELIKAGRSTVLIDTGPGTKVVSELDKLIPVYKRNVDVVLITHPNADHFGGLQELLKHYDIKVVLMNGVDTESGSYKNLVNAIKQSKIPIVFARRSQTVEFSGAKLSIVWPGLDLKVHASLPDRKLNDTSVVSRLEFRDFSALFAGDISANAEKVLASILPATDLLKVPHHGSKYSSTESFLSALRPEYAVIEVGKNSYGHPARETLTRLEDIGTRVFRTDVNGLVKVLWENGKWQIANGEAL